MWNWAFGENFESCWNNSRLKKENLIKIPFWCLLEYEFRLWHQNVVYWLLVDRIRWVLFRKCLSLLYKIEYCTNWNGPKLKRSSFNIFLPPSNVKLGLLCEYRIILEQFNCGIFWFIDFCWRAYWIKNCLRYDRLLLGWISIRKRSVCVCVRESEKASASYYAKSIGLDQLEGSKE